MKAINTHLGAALFLIVALPLPVNAATPGYTQLILRLKAGATLHHAVDNPAPSSELKLLAPGLTPVIPSAMTRTTESLLALQRHRLDRYYVVDTRNKTQAQAKELLAQLRRNPTVEMAAFEPIVDGMQRDSGSPAEHTARNDIPDYTGRQHYLLGDSAVAPYKIGGVNAVRAWDTIGGKGDGMRVISAEIDHWSYEHVDLPAPYTQLLSPTEPAETGSHDTASAGVIASRENGFGTTGIVPLAQLGYLQWGAVRLGEMAERLQAGDVLQLGVQYQYGDNDLPPDLCTTDCYIPLEDDDLVRDTIAYLTEEKGVHVVLAAANGNINLDHSYFRGRYDRNRFDSGAIYAGAVNPKTGLRSSFSEYGSRVDLFSWGDAVTTTTWSRNNPTTGYTHTYSGTSSSNPILAGVAASLQGVARAEGLGNIPPKTLRGLLVDTGYPQINGNRTEIGVQPDLDAAIKKMLADHVDRPPTGRIGVPEETNAGQTFSVHVYAESPSGKPLAYRWTAPGFSPATGTETSLTLTAPAVESDTLKPISVEVSDGRHTLKLMDNITIKALPDSGRCDGIAAWATDKTYATYGELVVYENKVYKQNFHNLDKRPDQHSADYGEPWFTGVACASGSASGS